MLRVEDEPNIPFESRLIERCRYVRCVVDRIGERFPGVVFVADDESEPAAGLAIMLVVVYLKAF
jgi:hypothetical protein